MVQILPLFSGSSGNATYIRDGDDEILVDAGVSCKMLCTALLSIGTELKNMKAILVTHEHSDHIKGLEVISRKFGIPVYMHASSFCALDKQSAKDSIRPHAAFIAPGDSLGVGNIHASVFKTPHDASASVGYRFTFSDGSSLGYATDIGYVTRAIAASLFGCETVILESNHDVEMLRNSPYPYYLKQRILSQYGHLSNDACASFLPHLYEHGTKKLILAHLSDENNTPRAAYEASAQAALNAGIGTDELKITVAMKSIISFRGQG